MAAGRGRMTHGAPPRVVLLTDFGTADGYVAAMKGVLAEMVPDVHLDDAGHDLPQGAVDRAAWSLDRYWRRYPKGVVHLVVVDPGVGTGRRALAVEADGRFVVAPDNGVVSRVLDRAESWRAVRIDEEGLGAGVARSATFHGRDVFAPTAALLARGEPLDALGPPLDDPIHEPEPEPVESEGTIRGEVVNVDRFGNLTTNVPGRRVREGRDVSIAGRSVRVRTTYGDVEEGVLLALVNSSDRLEVAVRNGSAARLLGVEEGAAVELSSEA